MTRWRRRSESSSGHHELTLEHGAMNTRGTKILLLKSSSNFANPLPGPRHAGSGRDGEGRKRILDLRFSFYGNRKAMLLNRKSEIKNAVFAAVAQWQRRLAQTQEWCGFNSHSRHHKEILSRSERDITPGFEPGIGGANPPGRTKKSILDLRFSI